MPVIDRLSTSLGRRDGLPNKGLAEDLCRTENLKEIEELVKNLRSKDGRIASDCLEVVEEIGKAKPALIARYSGVLLRLLRSRNNRLVWGAMTALASIALERPKELYENLALIVDTMKRGSVITVDNAVSVLARVASAGAEYERNIVPHLLEHLSTCRPKEVAQHAERCLIAFNPGNKARFLKAIASRTKVLTKSQRARVARVVKALEKDA